MDYDLKKKVLASTKSINSPIKHVSSVHCQPGIDLHTRIARENRRLVVWLSGGALDYLA